MTPRETLESCRSMAQECAKIAELIEIAEKHIPMGPSASVSVSLRDCPRGGNDATAAAIAHVDGLEEWYKREKAELVLLADQVEILLERVAESDSRKIIRLYYIDALSDTEVAMVMGWSRRMTACNKRKEILQEIDENA